MYRLALLILAALSMSACGSDGSDADVVASVQVDDRNDLVVIRIDEADLTPSLLICRVPHGDAPAVDSDSCAAVDPWRWNRASISASLHPGPTSSLVVVVHDQAGFRLVQPASIRTAAPVELHLPAGPIGSASPLILQVVVAESDLTIDNAIGCLTTGLAGGVNPVFITATSAGPNGGSTPAPAADLQTACI